MDINLMKTYSGWVPADPPTEEWSNKQKLGNIIHAKAATYRNLAFHRKLFALLNMAFDLWEPGEISSDYGTPQKNFDRFRKDIIILAGYYKTVIRLDGSVRVEADSISFSKMDAETFESLYSNVIDVLIKKVSAMKDMTPEDVDETVRKILEFA